MADDILYCNENGIEFWTVKATGESAISVRGLARMCGVRINSVQNILEGLTNGTPVKGLESLLGIALYLTNKLQRKGNEVKAIRSAIATKIIGYYARQGRAKAWDSFEAFAHIGFDSFAQGKTGWLPEEKQSARSSRNLIDCILENPKAWTVHFNPKWREEACRVTGYSWHPSRPMAQFISTYIYKAMPAEVYDRLMIVNADRKSRHHQFFELTADEVVLKEHIQQVGGLLRVSRNKEQFKRLFRDAYGQGIQVDFDFDSVA